VGISVTQLLIILAIIVVLFGTKRLRNLGGDLGGAIKGFRSAMKDSEKEDKKIADDDSVIDVKSHSKSAEKTEK